MSQKNNREKVLQEFFDFPTKRFHVRELCRKTKLSTTTVTKVINDLVKEKLVLREKTKVLHELKANLNDKKFKRAKQFNNLKEFYSSGLVDFLVKKYRHPEAIVLFGSYSRGEDWEDSDIDMVIITNRREDYDLSEFENKLKKEIQILHLKTWKISEKSKHNVINGITLYGKLC